MKPFNPVVPSLPPIPKPVMPTIPKLKTIQVPKPPSPSSPAAFKPIPLATPIKSILNVGGLTNRLSYYLSTKPQGTHTRTAYKPIPVTLPIAQQIANLQKQQTADIKRVEAADKADKRAQTARRRGLK